MTSRDDPLLLEPRDESAARTLDVLLRRMQTESDFPALSEAIGAINRIAASDREGVNQLSNNILKDFALTNKLLKLANVAFYSRAGSGAISTISRAVVVLGFDAVRSTALSLILLENFENKAHAQQLKEEFVKALYAGVLAREMAGKARLRDVEEAFIAAMLRNLGRMLVMFYFPAEAWTIRQLAEDAGLSDAQASSQVLGVSFEGLGMGVARSWGFPDQFVLSMRTLPAGKIRKAAGDIDRLRALAGLSNELCEVVLRTPDAERATALAGLTSRFGESVPVTAEQLAALMERAMQEVGEFARAVGVNLKGSAFAERAANWAGMAAVPQLAPTPSVVSGANSEAAAALGASVLHAQPALVAAQAAPAADKVARSSEETQSILASGLQDVSNSLIDESISINDILRMILETMYSGMQFKHVLMCIKDVRRNAMVGKFGFGDGVQALIRAFDFSLAGQPDVFLVALQNNADILISDVDDPKIATRIPAWYRQHVAARTFVLFPVLVKGKPVGLIYADRDEAGGIAIPEKELSLLKSLRNQGVLAIRQSL